MRIVLPLINVNKLGFWKRGTLRSLSKRRTAGNVKLTANSVCVSRNRNTIHYYLSDVTYLEIRGDLFLEFSKLDFYDLEPDQKLIHSGRTKFIISLEKQKIEVNFLINSKKEFETVSELVKSWYKSKRFKIREYDSMGSRMLVLNPYRTYESIQIIKKEIGIESMYE